MTIAHQEEMKTHTMEEEVTYLLSLTTNKRVEEIKMYLTNHPSTKKGRLFELYVQALYEGNGFLAICKGGKHDGGADILLFDPRHPQKVISIVQAKNHKRPLTVDDTALELYKFDTIASKQYNCPHYKLISLSGFVADAEDEDKFQTMQKHLNIALHDWAYIEELILAYDPFNHSSPHIDLHAHNKMAYENILTQWEHSNRVAAVQATGTGKSFIIAKCLSDFATKKKIVLAPSHYILKQLVNNFPWIVFNTTFMTYQKAASLPIEEIEQLDVSLIVLDEFHRIGAEKWGDGITKLVHHYPHAKILGTSATPIRFLDGNRDMSVEFFENNVANELSLAEAIVQKILPTPKYISAIYTLDEEIELFKEKIMSSENSKDEKEILLQQLSQLSINWASTHGIEHILHKHIRNENKFIVFCENKNHVEEMEVFVENWFRKARLNKRIRKYRVMSGNKHNKSELNEFINGQDEDSIYLLFSIDMLNEGMHIQDVDGVILLRKTTSPIIFYQQIGRAMDANKKNTPLILDLVNNFSLIKTNDFLHDLNNAELKYRHFRSTFGLPNINAIFELSVFDETLEAQELFTRLQKELIDGWQLKFKELLEYKKLNGDCLVPSTYDSNPSLSHWVTRQRVFQNKGLLTPDKVDKLNEIGFVWDSYEVKWENMYKVMCDYKSIHGDCLVKFNQDGDNDLFHWVATQRKKYKDKTLPKDKTKQLNEIDFSWHIHDEKWEKMFKLLIEYKNTYGDFSIKKQHKEDKEIKSLIHWLRNQISCFKKGTLEQEKIDRFLSIQFPFNFKEEKWDKMYNALLQYHSTYGNCFLDVNREDHKSLINWVQWQRQSFKKGSLSENKIERLNQIGFIWDYKEEKWEKMFLELTQFKTLHGNCDSVNIYKVSKKLGDWVGFHKTSIRMGTLPLEKLEKLNSIGFVSNPREVKWLEMYDLLKEYFVLNGDCLVPSNYKENKELGNWTRRQRQNFKNGVLTENQLELLNQIDFVWNPLEYMWTKNFTLLKEYKEKHGNCLVPCNKKEIKELGAWVGNQRKLFKTNSLNQDKINKLNAIGFAWEIKK